MNRNSSSSSFTDRSLTPSSSFDDPIRAPTLIVPLRAVHESESILVNDIPSVLTEKDVDHLHYHYQISQEIFCIYTPSPSLHVDNQIPMENTIMVYEEQLNASLQFPMDPFFTKVLRFYKFSVTQLHPNSWRILVAFRFICFNNNIESSVTLFSQLYQLGTLKNEKFWFFNGRKRQTYSIGYPHP